ncbi:MAG: DUF2855 family protein [Alphaproteobacteria bacterium]|uniref:DUF2855 family protein n=1 Tax=Maricaulis alexandrii TaxID=2570354 RepID=UPI001107AE6A|nr:DUF2855 family protein [Maricaulis alexandrii]MCR9266728.1 DUF2855 family protein [Alphaproteobacteria bacterium]
MGWSLSIDKTSINDAKIAQFNETPLQDGETRLRVDRFALTANNITYAAFGHAMRYWDFFPGEDGRGRLPVWGFAEIVENTVEGLSVGERIYGYFPAGSELIVKPGRIEDQRFFDMAEHRAELAPAYNTYTRCAADPAWSQAMEPAQMVLQPLFITAFLLDFHLRDKADGPVLLTSASSKTAIALAFLLKAAGKPAHALTSPRNADFVKGLDLYDGVTTYDDLDGLTGMDGAVIVDFAGDSKLNKALHETLAGQLEANIRVGGAHWENSAPPKDLPPPKPQFFFAPDAARTLIKEWGQDEFDRVYKSAWTNFANAASNLFDFQAYPGADGCQETYDALIKGEVPAKAALYVQN